MFFVLTFIFLFFVVSTDVQGDDGCLPGDYCSNNFTVDRFYGCNDFGSYCTQAYQQVQGSCDTPDCSYRIFGDKCVTSTCTITAYIHEGSCCANDGGGGGGDCSCTSWSNIGCGANGCDSDKMRQERSCTPTACDQSGRCVDDSSCSCTTISCGPRCSASYDCKSVEWTYNSCDFDSCEDAASGGAAVYPDDYSDDTSCCSCTPCNGCTSVGCGECSTTTSGYRCQCTGSCGGQYANCDGVQDSTCTLCTGCDCTPDSCSGSYPLTSCPSGHSCSSTTHTCTKVDSCGVACGGTNSRTCYKDNSGICTGCDCTPDSCSGSYPLTSCPSGHSCSSTTHTCTKVDSCGVACGGSESRTCYRDDGLDCTPGCTPSCSPDYTTPRTPDGGNRWASCTDDCGDLDGRTCYCLQCTVSSCPINTSTSGDGALFSSPSCSNNCGWSDSNNCYYVCEDATCTDLVSEVNWLDSCPAGETCESITTSVPISTVYPECPTSETKTCYYPNSDPEVVSIEISPTTVDNNVLNYTSTDHTGIELNNPITVTATYFDSDNAQDIKAMYVWFSKPKSELISKDFTTPTYYIEDIDPNLGQTEDNSNFGLMFVRGGTGWDVYIPHITTTSSWVKKDNNIQPTETIKIVREIDGGVEKTMVTVTQITITEPDSDRVQVSMDMTFEDGDEPNEELVDNGSYTVWGNVNDISGFDPLLDTLNEIRKPNNWVYQNDTWSGTIWNLDMREPNVSIPSIKIVDGQTIKVTVQGTNASDGMNLSYARLDACKTGGTAYNKLIVEGITYPVEGTALSPCTGYAENLSNFDMGNPANSLLLGDSDIGSTFNPEILDSVEKEIYLNDNKRGVITFYLTLMDVGGNYVQSHVNLKLGDWAVVEDGLVFGRSGTSSETRELEDNTKWNGSILLDYVDEEERPIDQYMDLSNQALLGSMASPTSLRSLVHSSNTKAFKASNIKGTISDSIFTDLFGAFQNKSQGDDFDVYEIPADSISEGMTLTDINGDGTPNCEKEYCVLTQFEDESELTIGKGFNCNGKGLIIVDGNITINPDFTNTASENACIILASGDITITPGDDVVVGTPGYDQIQAFLIANGNINIPAENKPPKENSDGLIVEGGLIAVSNGTDLGSSTSIINERDIHHTYQLLKPVIFVKGRSKYSFLSKSLFGSQVDIFKTELGFKPY